jgi:hypothetical protein
VKLISQTTHRAAAAVAAARPDTSFEAFKRRDRDAEPLILMFAGVGRHVPDLISIFADRAIRREPPDSSGIKD